MIERKQITSNQYMMMLNDEKYRGADNPHNVYSPETYEGENSKPEKGFIVVFSVEPEIEYHVVD